MRDVGDIAECKGPPFCSFGKEEKKEKEKEKEKDEAVVGRRGGCDRCWKLAAPCRASRGTDGVTDQGALVCNSKAGSPTTGT